MITVTTSESAVHFEFDGSQHYLYDGTMEVPFNSLILVEDESDMITFRKASTNDILFSAMYTEFSSLGDTKDDVVGALEGMIFAEGGGGGGVDPEDVVEIVESALTDYWTSAQTQSAINQASSGKQDTLVSGTNIKTINNESLLGSGNITISGGGATYEYYTENTETKSANIHIEDTDEQTSGDLGVDGSSAMMFASGTETDVEETIVRNTGINVNPWEASMSYDRSIDDEPTTYSYVSVGETVGLGVQSDIDPQPYSHLDVHKGDISLEVRSDEDHMTTFAVSNSAVTINGENVATVNDIPSYSAGTGIDITNNVISATGGSSNFVELTQAQYDALVSGGTVDPDVLYIISDAQEINLSGYALSSAVTAEIAAAVSGKADSSAVTQSLSSKQDTLVSGTNIKTINNQSLLGSGNIDIQGGGGVTVDQSLDSGSTNPVANSAITTALNGKQDILSEVVYSLTSIGNYTNGHNVLYQKYKHPSYDYTVTSFFEFGNINGKSVLFNQNNPFGWDGNFNLVETSAITTSMTSSSTDAQVPSAKAVYDQLGGLKFVSLTQSEYDALVTKDSTTIYFIKDNSN